jgi:hypothetical protein
LIAGRFVCTANLTASNPHGIPDQMEAKGTWRDGSRNGTNRAHRSKLPPLPVHATGGSARGGRGRLTCGTGEAAAGDEAGEGRGGGGGGRRRRNETRCHRDDSTRSGLGVSLLLRRVKTGGGAVLELFVGSRFLLWAGPGVETRPVVSSPSSFISPFLLGSRFLFS